MLDPAIWRGRKGALMRQSIAAHAQFGTRLLTELAARDPAANLLLSPITLAFALQITLNGTSGRSGDELQLALGLEELSLEEINEASLLLREALAYPAPGIRLAMANALWVKQGVTIAPSFLETLERYYHARAASVNFADPATLDAINRWFSDMTSGKIPDLLSAGDLSPQTDTILSSAAYFKGEWHFPFAVEETREGPFTLVDGRQLSLPMMSRSFVGQYQRGDGYEVVRVPYKEGGAAMYLYLPSRSSSVGQLLAQLGAERWRNPMDRPQRCDIHLVLPRFLVRHQAELKDVLVVLGIEAAFTLSQDFQPMGLPRHGIGQVKQKAILEVNEEGTEAAFSMAEVCFMGINPAPPQEVTVVIDRPFLCAIQDEQTKALLFLGVIQEPGQG